MISRIKKLLRSINPKFSMKQLKESCGRLRETLIKDFKVVHIVNQNEFSKTCLIFLMLLNLVGGISAAITNTFIELYVSAGTILGLIIAICVLIRFKQYTHVTTITISICYIIVRLTLIHFFINYQSRVRLFFAGYGLANLQAILLLRLVRISHKIYAMIIGLILRFVYLCAIVQPGTFDVSLFLRHLLMDSFIVYTICCQDISFRKVYQDFIHKKDELLKFKELLADYLPQSLIVVNCEANKALFYNKAFQSTFLTHADNLDLISSQNVVKLPFSSLIVEQSTIREAGSINLSVSFLDSSDHFASIEEVLEGFKSEKCLHVNTISLAASLTDENKRMLFEVTIQRVKWDSEEAIAILLNDITYQENLISLKLANTKKDKVLATVSHELRTPLNGIIGIMDIAEKKVDDPEVVEYLTLCKDNAHLLLSLVNSILDFQMIAQGKLKLNPTNLDIRKVVQSVCQLFYFQCKQKDIYLETDINEDVPEIISTDENRLKQILINLVGNAIKFTQKGRVKIEVSQYQLSQSSLQISVSDTGIGIKKEDHKYLFKMYSKIEEAEGVNKNGVGLGLTISNALAKLLNGSEESAGINVESELGNGSRFFFTIQTNLEDKKVIQKTQDEFDFSHRRIATTGSSGDETIKGLLIQKTETCEEHKTSEDEEYDLKDHQQNDCDEFFASDNLHSKITCYTSLKMISYPKSPTRNNPSQILPQSKQESPREKTLIKTTKMQNRQRPKSKTEYKIENPKPDVHVLIVDDNPFNLLVAKNLLKDLGCNSTTALGGQEAIEIVKRNASTGLVFKVVFMDCQMPIMDGFETTMNLLRMMKNKEIPDIPIYAWTANNSEEDVKRCYDVGMVGHLSKPASKTDVFKVISKL